MVSQLVGASIQVRVGQLLAGGDYGHRVRKTGDLGGDPHSVKVFHEMGLDGVSASPWLVPVSTLAAAQANLIRPRVSAG